MTLSLSTPGTFSLDSFWFQLLGNGRSSGNTLQLVADGTSYDFAEADYPNNNGGQVVSPGLSGVSSVTFQNLNSGNVRIDDITVSYDDITLAPVPLPASALLLLAGLGGIAAVRRRARS